MAVLVNIDKHNNIMLMNEERRETEWMDRMNYMGSNNHGNDTVATGYNELLLNK